mmetsp:Transcript_7524/g.18194  ORF Transcript_7524/g.18194 Transcript_7524/m.18194 type:complete len:359 (-) Transcript_7524:4795-5871(-)
MKHLHEVHLQLPQGNVCRVDDVHDVHLLSEHAFGTQRGRDHGEQRAQLPHTDVGCSLRVQHLPCLNEDLHIIRTYGQVVKQRGCLNAVKDDTNDQLQQDVAADQHEAAKVQHCQEGLQAAVVLPGIIREHVYGAVVVDGVQVLAFKEGHLLLAPILGGHTDRDVLEHQVAVLPDHGCLHDVMPVLARYHPKLSDHGDREMPEVCVPVNAHTVVVIHFHVAPQVHAHDGPQVHEQEQHVRDIGHSRNRPVKCAQQLSQTLCPRDEAEDPSDTQGTEYRQERHCLLAKIVDKDSQYGQRRNECIKAIPVGLEVRANADGDQLATHFCSEDDGDNEVCHVDGFFPSGAHSVVCKEHDEGVS